MLKIRLQRVGRKHDPSFRVVLTDSKSGPQSGKYLEILGSYDARTDKTVFKAEEIKKHIANGAQPSETVHNLLVSNNVIEGKKVNVLPKKTPIVREKTEEEKAAEEAANAPAEETATEGAPEAEAPVEATPAVDAVEEKTEETPAVEEEKKEEITA